MLALEWRKENTYSLLEQVPASISTMDFSMKFFLKILKIYLPYDPSILLLYIFPKDSISFPKYTCSPIFITALLSIQQKRKQPRKGLIDKWITKCIQRNIIPFKGK